MAHSHLIWHFKIQIGLLIHWDLLLDAGISSRCAHLIKAMWGIVARCRFRARGTKSAIAYQSELSCDKRSSSLPVNLAPVAVSATTVCSCLIVSGWIALVASDSQPQPLTHALARSIGEILRIHGPTAVLTEISPPFKIAHCRSRPVRRGRSFVTGQE
jgi:hypothetical protein